MLTIEAQTWICSAILYLSGKTAQMSTKYVLLTAARNEEGYISFLLNSVVRQTLLPVHWTIISDGSTDRTEEIAKSYCDQYPFIELQVLVRDRARSFAGKFQALNRAYRKISRLGYDFVGFFDADVSFAQGYCEQLLNRFQMNPRLGVAGGFVHESQNGNFAPRFATWERNVAGACQFFRKECFEKIGGFIPLHYGGTDSVAVDMARMNGWEARAFPDLTVYHHRHTGTEGRSVYQARFREGVADYIRGCHPLYESAKFVYRLAERPYVLSSVMRLAGYSWSFIRSHKQNLPKEYLDFMRQDQLNMLMRLIKHKRMV